MPFSFTNICIWMLPPLAILIGPFTWMKCRWFKKIKEHHILWALPFLAFLMTFGTAPHFWDNNYADNWNDGSYGFMHSQHYLEAYPGGTGWNDLYWLGQSEGEYPIDFSYCIIWLGNRGLIVPLVLFLISLRIYIRCLGKKS